MIIEKHIFSVLGYTVKYTPSPSGVPSGTPEGKGVCLTVYPLYRPNTDTIVRAARCSLQDLVRSSLSSKEPKIGKLQKHFTTQM